MAGKNDAIQLLLKAEKLAFDKVNEAKKRKAKRLKQAKLEAQSEVDKVRADCENQFQETEKKVMGNRTDVESQINDTTQKKIIELAGDVASNREAALQLVLSFVYDIKPELHINFRN